MGKYEDETARELRRNRPSPSDDFVSSLARSVSEQTRSQRIGHKAVAAIALSIVAAAALAATGGMAQTVDAPKSVAAVVKKAVTKPVASKTKVAAARPAAAKPQPSTPVTVTSKSQTAKGPAATSSKATSSKASIVPQALPQIEPQVQQQVQNTVTLVLDTPANDQYGGAEGCTPGFWKNHSESWVGFTTSQTVGSVFSSAPASVSSLTLLQGLEDGGGAEFALTRHAIAALLNAAHPSVDYPQSTSDIITMVNAAFASGDATQIETLKNTLDALNNAHAPGFCE